MFPYKIIGLLGRSRVGKDTVADMLCDATGKYQVVRLSYPLKKAVCCLYDLTMDQLETSAKESVDARWNKTPREVIQSLTDYMMNYMGHDFFTKILLNHYDNGKYSEHIIIPDIRYPHDIVEIQKRGGIVIKVERPNNPIRHEFENHIDTLEGNITIVNDKGLDHLREKINQILKSTETA